MGGFKTQEKFEIQANNIFLIYSKLNFDIFSSLLIKRYFMGVWGVMGILYVTLRSDTFSKVAG